MSKRALIHTLGCRLNHAETEILSDRLAQAGYTLAGIDEPADLCIINTCTVTQEADAKSRKLIRGIIRRNPKAFVAVIGCYAQLAPDLLAEIPGIDLILGNREKLNVLDYVLEGKSAAPRVVCGELDAMDFEIEPADPAPVMRRANLKIQDGCDGACSYCAVPLARGPARSRDLENLVEEARRLVGRGAREIVVTGVNVGAYHYQGRGLVDVLDRLNGIEGLARIRLGSIEFTTIPDALFDRMNDPRHALVPFLHVPLQSGSDRILERMNRPYRAAAAIEFFRKAESAVADLCIGADILVGMPGESDENFEVTCRLLAESPITYTHVFKYSDRAGAPAARMTGKIDPRTLHHRSEHVRRVSDAKRRAFQDRFLGRTLEVLFEDWEDGHWWGYTGNYIRVAVCYESSLANAIRPVALETNRGEFVIGRAAV